MRRSAAAGRAMVNACRRRVSRVVTEGATDDSMTRGMDRGTAIIEFVFVAIVVLVPLVYLIAAVASVQRAQLAVTQAARDAGRAFATSDTQDAASPRAAAAVHLAMRDQDLPDDSDVRFVAEGASCGSARVTPVLRPGAQFTVCVTRQVALPGIPSVLAGRGVRVVGAYVVHVDDFRTVR